MIVLQNIGEAKQNCIELIVYHCDICAGEFTSCYEYLDHQEEHNGQQVFQCDKCTKVSFSLEAKRILGVVYKVYSVFL